MILGRKGRVGEVRFVSQRYTEHSVDRNSNATSRWEETLVSSQLLGYETWTRLNGLGLAGTHGKDALDLLGRVALLELFPQVLARALEPFPGGVRTLDA